MVVIVAGDGSGGGGGGGGGGRRILMVVNYSKLSDDGKYQNITIDQGVQGNAFEMPTLDDFKMRLLKSESYVILYDFHSLPINLGVSQRESSSIPQLVKTRRHYTSPADYGYVADPNRKYFRDCQGVFKEEELLDPMGESGKDCEEAVRVYDGGKLNGTYRDKDGYFQSFSFNVYANQMFFRRRSTSFSIRTPEAEKKKKKKRVASSIPLSLALYQVFTQTTVGDIRIDISSLSKSSEAYKRYATTGEYATARRITFKMNEPRFSSRVETKHTTTVRAQLSEGLSAKGYPATGPVLWKVIYGTGPTFGAGTINDKDMLMEGRNIIVGGSYAMIKKSDYDALIRTRRDLGLSIERFKKRDFLLSLK